MDKVIKILTEIRPDVDFGTESGFVENGLLDSFDMVSLVSALEDEFGILIDGLDIVPENFDSVEGIAALVEKSGGSL